MAALAVVGAIGSAVIGGIGALQEGAAANAAAQYNAQQYETAAKTVEEQGHAEANKARRENRRLLGQMRAQYGASGITLEGSPLDVLEDTAAEGELEAQQKIYSGRVQAVEYRNKASLSRMQGESAKKAGYIGAVGKLFDGAGKVGMALA